MDTQIVAIYCLCDDILKGLHHHEDDQCRMSDAKVMTTSIVAATFFAGNMEKSRCFLNEHRYILNMLGKSRFNRRQHWIAELFLIPAWMTYLLACYRKVIETAGNIGLLNCFSFQLG